MQITIFSFLSALLWSSLLIVAIYLLRHTRFKQHFGVLSMVLLYLFCAVRLFLPLEFPHTLIAEDDVVYPYIYNLLTRERTMLANKLLRPIKSVLLDTVSLYHAFFGKLLHKFINIIRFPVGFCDFL